VQKRTAELIRAITARISGHEKGVVYCRSRAQCVAIAEAIGYNTHYSSIDEKEREEV
jgi:superfamily II DNA helicase RecQ